MAVSQRKRFFQLLFPHLLRGSGDGVSLSSLRSNLVLEPLPDRDAARLPEVIAEINKRMAMGLRP